MTWSLAIVSYLALNVQATKEKMVTLMSSELKRVNLKGHYHKIKTATRKWEKMSVNLTRDCI